LWSMSRASGPSVSTASSSAPLRNRRIWGSSAPGSVWRGSDTALLRAVRHSGRSIVFNVLVFSLGFLSLLASDFTPIVHLGALVALALVISGFMSLFLLSVLAPWFIHGEARRVETSEVPVGVGV
jgi:hypothetical protein